jgi:hypothetical protein
VATRGAHTSTADLEALQAALPPGGGAIYLNASLSPMRQNKSIPIQHEHSSKAY